MAPQAGAGRISSARSRLRNPVAGIVGVAVLASVAEARPADEPEIVIPLEDSEREVVIMPKKESLEAARWDARAFESAFTERLARQAFEGKLDPASIVTELGLSDIVAAAVRPITFLPQERLEDLATRLLAGEAKAEQASAEVWRLRGRAREIIPLLLPALSKGTSYRQVSYLCRAIESVGPHASAAVPVLVEKVLEAEDLDKSWFARVLARIGRPAIADLERLMRSPESEWTRRAAADALAEAGRPGIASLEISLTDADWMVRAEAARALAVAAQEPGIVEALLPLLSDERAEVRRATGASMGRAGESARGAVTGLLRLLDEGTRLSEEAALFGLAGIPSSAGATVPRLRSFLAKPVEAAGDDLRVLLAALWAVQSFGRDASALAPQVAACLRRGEPVRSRALGAIAAIGGKEAAVAAKEVESLLADESFVGLPDALDALFAMGPDGAGAAAGVKKLLIAGPARERAIEVLGAMGVGPAREALDDCLVSVTHERGSVSLPPESVVRVMASADLTRTIALVFREAGKEKQSFLDQAPAMAGRALVLLRAIEADLAAVEEALRGREVQPVAATPRVAGSSPVHRPWKWIERWHRVLREGDPISRVVALLGRPAAAGPDALEYRSVEGGESSAQGRTVKNREMGSILRVGLEGGRVKEVSLAPAR